MSSLRRAVAASGQRMTPRLWAALVVCAVGLLLLARICTALVPWGLALAAWVALGGAFVLVVLVSLRQGEDD